MRGAMPITKERTKILQFGKLPGKRLVYDVINKQWESKPFKEVNTVLKSADGKPRIIFVESSRDRKLRLKEEKIDPDDDDPQTLEWFCKDNECKDYMIKKLCFPECLFEESWFDCNGFAGVKRLENGVNRKYISLLSRLRIKD